MEAAPRRFLFRAALAAVLMLVPVAGINFAVDPYGILGRPQTLVDRCEPGIRAGDIHAVQLALARAEPQVVLAGNSRVLRGHDTRDPTIGARAFNLGWAGATFGAVHARLVAAGHAPRVLVLGFGPGEFMPRAETEIAGARPEPRWRTVTAGFVGWTATLASLRTLVHPQNCAEPQRRFDGDPGASLDARGRAPQEPDRENQSVDASLARFYADAAARTRETADGALSAASSAEFVGVLDWACARGTRVVALFQPAHARLLEILWQSGAWPAAEAIKRYAAREVARARAAGCDAELWDFSAYNEYTTGPLPEPGARVYFAESSHYTPALGRLVTRRVFGAAEAFADFGHRLEPRTIEARLQMLRVARERYVAQHPELAVYARTVLSAVPARVTRLREHGELPAH